MKSMNTTCRIQFEAWLGKVQACWALDSAYAEIFAREWERIYDACPFETRQKVTCYPEGKTAEEMRHQVIKNLHSRSRHVVSDTKQNVSLHFKNPPLKRLRDFLLNHCLIIAGVVILFYGLIFMLMDLL